jgi:hypothetical protein
MAASFRQSGGEEVGLANVSKGTKRMLATEGEGMPLAFLVTGANRAEVKLAEATLDRIRVPRERGALGSGSRGWWRTGRMTATRSADGCAGTESSRAYPPTKQWPVPLGRSRLSARIGMEGGRDVEEALPARGDHWQAAWG